MLNSSYKLVSSCIANRIKPILPFVIESQQKGFIKGRNIAECTREIYDFLFESEADNVPGMLLLIDFQKAFDSIAWDFVHFALRKFEFPQTIIDWISMTQLNSTSRVTQCGWMSESFALQRGCRQGDPLSPYVFILCAEFLSRAIINAKEIQGFVIKGQEKKLTQFADDTTLFLNGSKQSLRKAISVLGIYEEASGLKMNLTKTKAIWAGKNRFSEDKICHEIELDWVHQFTALGIQYDVHELQNIMSLNCMEKMAEMDRILLNWGRRNTTLVGRILVIKSLALSKLVHFFIALPTPPKDFFREINKKFYRFLWKGKPPKIKKTTLELDIKDGGLKMVNVETFEKTLKTKWLKTVLTSNENWALIPKSHKIDKVGNYGTKFYKEILTLLKNPFWISMVRALESFHQLLSEKNTTELTMNSPIWFNPLINIEFVKKWDDKGLRCLGDVFEEDGCLKSREKLSDDFNINFNFIDYARLIKAIPNEYILRKNEFDREELNPWCQQYVLFILGDNKSNQKIKHEFLKKEPHLSIIDKWETLLTIPDDHLFWNKIFILTKQCNQDVWMQMFQYKTLHRILATNKKLFQYKIIDTPLCSYCGMEEETIQHIFCECDLATSIWHEITGWLKKQGRSIEYLRDSQIILGDPKLDPVINRIILTTKIAIFKNKEKSPPKINQIIAMLRSQFTIEKFNAEKTNKLKFFRGFWAPIWNSMNKGQNI